MLHIRLRLSESKATAGGQIIWVYGLEQQCWVAEKGGRCARSQIHGQRRMPDTSYFSLSLSLFSLTECSSFWQWLICLYSPFANNLKYTWLVFFFFQHPHQLFKISFWSFLFFWMTVFAIYCVLDFFFLHLPDKLAKFSMDLMLQKVLQTIYSTV